ncbi:hypothetical protein [Paraglaciecola aestuariivivens]
MNKNLFSKSWLIMAAMLTSACQTNSSSAAQAAIVANPSAQSRLILQQGLGELFNSAPIQIADSAFTVNSSILIERANRQEREMGIKPVDSISLLIKQGQCWLRHDQSNKMLLLAELECKLNPNNKLPSNN